MREAGEAVLESDTLDSMLLCHTSHSKLHQPAGFSGRAAENTCTSEKNPGFGSLRALHESLDFNREANGKALGNFRKAQCVL